TRGASPRGGGTAGRPGRVQEHGGRDPAPRLGPADGRGEPGPARHCRAVPAASRRGAVPGADQGARRGSGGRQPPRMAGGAGGRRPAAGGHRRAYGPRRVEWRGGAGRKALDEDPRRSPHARRSRLHTACGLGPPRARARHTGPGVMLQLTVDDVRLGVRVRDKADAIRAAGRLLVERGYIDAGYVDSMLGREEQANTYLGSGVAIPHGLGKDRGLIYRTGVSVLQLADVLEWNPGQPVSLVVGIAATSDDHIGIL